jgi:multiple sugar transport system substrate-binding protein
MPRAAVRLGQYPVRTGLLIVLAGALLSACVGGSPKTTTSAGPSGGAKTGQLLVWDWDSSSPGFAASFKQLDANFEKAHPGVTIKRVVQPFGNYADLFQATISAGSGPCVAELLAASSGPGVLRYQNSLVPLNSLLSDDARQNLFGLNVATAGYQTDGTLYGIPFGLQPTVMYYNKRLFVQAGLDPANPPKSYNDLVAAAKKLRAAGITPFIGGDKETATTEWWFGWLWPGAGSKQDTFDLASGKLPFTDGRVEATVSRYTDLVSAGYFEPGMASTPIATAADDFGNGKGAMFIGLGAGGFGSYVPFDKALGADNVGVIESNGGDSDTPHFLTGGPASTWGLTKYCKMQGMAAQYVQYITGAEGTKILYDDGGILPGWKAVQVPSDAPPQVLQMVSDFRGSDSLYGAPGLWGAATKADYLKQVQLVLGGQQSVQTALQKVEETAKSDH